MTNKLTQKMVVMPWLKGLNTSMDAGVLQVMGKPDQLVLANNIVYTLSGSKKTREGFEYVDTTSGAITNTPDIVGLFDYWANVSSTKTQRIVACTNEAVASKLWYYTYDAVNDEWDRTELTAKAGTSAPVVPTRVFFEVFNEDLIIAFDAASSTALKKWNNQTGTEYEDLGGSPPSGLKYLRTHQGRLWAAGDPANPDRLYFTSPANHEEWNGIGDSGAIDIDPGDGDDEGITAIFPSFKGRLIVAKRHRLYQVTGNTPETYAISPITRGIGCVSHNSVVAIDQDDIYFASDRGFHALTVTQSYGDFEGVFLSTDIQESFLGWDKTHLRRIVGKWWPTMNSVVWNIGESSSTPEAFILFDVRYKAWYRWAPADAYSMAMCYDPGIKKHRLFFGNGAGRLCACNSGTYHDYTNTAISVVLKSPFLYPDANPATVKGFKKLGVYFKPSAYTFNLTGTVLIAGNSQTQTIAWPMHTSGAPALDIDFLLGTSILGQASNYILTPSVQPIDGYGTSCQIQFSCSIVDRPIEIFGFFIEWEYAGDGQETIGY